MNKTLTLFFTLFTCVVFSQKYDCSTLISGVDYVPGSIITKLKPGHHTTSLYSDTVLMNYLNHSGFSSIVQLFPYSAKPSQDKDGYGRSLVDISTIYEIHYNSSKPLDELLKKLFISGHFEYVQPRFINKSLYIPNDSAIGSQYYLDKIKAYDAWDIVKGDSNIRIALTDVGADFTHSDLQTTYKANINEPIDGLDNDGNGYVDDRYGWDFYDNDNDLQINSSISNHGMAVGALISASTDNQNGIAGVGFNSKITPVSIGFAFFVTHGYDGLIYAADQAAQIINCSWGGPHRFQFEKDVIDYCIINKDALVIAACGNSNNTDPLFPASFEGVFSIAATDEFDHKASFSTYNKFVDFSAPGDSILTVNFGDTYFSGSGTSAAAPMVAGAAALVKQAFPSLNMQQVGHQLKVTTDDIYPVNPNYQNQLGTGRLNMHRALTNFMPQPSISLENVHFDDFNDNLYIQGDTIHMTGSIINYLSPSNTITATLSSNSSIVQVINPVISVGSLNTMGSFSLQNNPWRIEVLPTNQFDTIIELTVHLNDGSFDFYNYYHIEINPNHIDIEHINDIATTVVGDGSVGYNKINDWGYGVEGFGFHYPISHLGSDHAVFSSGIKFMLGSNNLVSDNVFQLDTSFFQLDQNGNWQIIDSIVLDQDLTTSAAIREMNSGLATFETISSFEEQNHNTETTFKTYSFDHPGHRKYYIAEYNIVNQGNLVQDLYAGLFADWYLSSSDIIATDTSRFLGYCYSAQQYIGSNYVGVKLLNNHQLFHHYGIDIMGDSGSLNIDKNFSDHKKYTTLSTDRHNAGDSLTSQNKDVAHTLSCGPFDINANDTFVVAFAILIGDSIDDLLNAADSAQTYYDLISTGTPVGDPCSSISVSFVPGNLSQCQFEQANFINTSTNVSNYEWYINNSLVSNAYHLNQNIVDTGLVEIKLKGHQGFCSKESSVILQVHPTPVIDLGPDTTICKGDSITLSGDHFGSYNWSTGSTNQNIMVSLSGSYSLTNYTQYGCTATDSIQVDLMGCTTTNNEELIHEEIIISPNPFQDEFNVYSNEQVLFLSITDVRGKELVRTNSINQTIDLKEFQAGVYFLQLDFEGDKKMVRRIVKL
ncbi:MAG: S8 family peptidase [Flavobacteriales bacterium]|nr:S8 family peptidase [Flavobacteriales bacterium]